MEPLRIWFDPPHVRWGRVAVTVVVATALVGVWVAQRRGAFEEAPAVVAVAKAASGAAIASPTPAAPSARSGMLAAASAPAPAASTAELVCGFGSVSFNPQDEQQVDALRDELFTKLEAHRVERLPGWLHKMKASADEGRPGGGRFTQAVESWRRKVLPAVEEQNKHWTKLDMPIDGLDELARLAQRSADPKVYGTAMNACGFLADFSPKTACAGLGFEEWARRDPDNGYPWLLASTYQPKGSARREEFIERAVATKTIRSDWGYAYEPLARALAPSASAKDRSALFAQAVTFSGIQMMAPVSVIEHCREDELRRGSRRTRCEYLATHLSENSDSFMLRQFGHAIGRNLGWSKDRLDSMKQELDAMQTALVQVDQTIGCEGLSKIEAYFSDLTKYGEVGALRRRQQAAR
ncbi:hypothetical protein FSC37_02155 [Piscinibacter aquaticus]|uniref:Uncharacterized protein n=1 Tax=Piscinibacter aquaticus TaxID=392597 RepID=A0A5C6U0Y5_9BURK|nr:hypothetical protein FSC37_02155 [Piscinibacter aquaticus]